MSEVWARGRVESGSGRWPLEVDVTGLMGEGTDESNDGRLI